LKCQVKRPHIAEVTFIKALSKFHRQAFGNMVDDAFAVFRTVETVLFKFNDMAAD
jgi:hypothetical protein